VRPTPAELAEEQAYFDTAQKHRERRRADLGGTPAAAANPSAAKWLRSWVKNKKDAARGPREAVVRHQHMIAGDNSGTGNHVEVRRTVDQDRVVAGEGLLGKRVGE
jgi:hypothetical protein